MKKTLFRLFAAGLIAAGAFALTNAFFSDTETSSNNTFQAGSIDLKVDNTSYYNGVFNQNTSWDAADLNDSKGPDNGTYKFFNFLDVKPGDWGEDTISLHVDTNDAWACYDVTLTSNLDNTCTEPELIDEPLCRDDNHGELADAIHIAVWLDDGDNVLETGEPLIANGLISAVAPTLQGALADSAGGILGLQGQPLKGQTPYYLGKAWCFGDFTFNPVDQDGSGFTQADGGNGPDIRHSGILCNGQPLDNSTQTDSLTGDITFTAIQARNNPNYLCTGVTPTPTGEPSPTPTATPTPTACLNQADVMLVLDRSGSINNTELASLKTAATAFVTALNPSINGAHIGEDSFATTATLDQTLTDNPILVNNAINALVNGGFTDLYDALVQTNGELTSIRDRDDTTSPDYVILITDGNPNRPLPDATAQTLAANAATTLKNNGTTIYVLGVGTDVNATYLTNQIASPGDYYPVADYGSVSTALGQIVTSCGNNGPTTGN